MGSKNSRPEPQSATYRRAVQWFSQAAYDLRAVDSDMGENGLPPSYEWACFKCQQAGEKSIKAVLILHGMPLTVYRDNISKLHNTDAMAKDTHQEWIRGLARQLYQVTGSVGKMRYPSYSAGGGTDNVPHQAYSKEQAKKAKNIATKLVNQIQDTYKFPGSMTCSGEKSSGCTVS